MQIFAKLFLLLLKVCRRIRMLLMRKLFAGYGRDFRFDPDGSYTFENIFVGDGVSLGYCPVLMAAKSKIRIGSHVMFGPEVVIVAGNHNTSEIGQVMSDVKNKRPEDDQDVVIDDDVWVGARAVILQGVNVGRGSIIGAGSIVNKSVPPYAIVAGNPARIIKFRWDVKTILEHEKGIYPSEERIGEKELEGYQTFKEMLPPRRVGRV